MEYSIQIGVREIDARSSQFSCEIVVVNGGDEPFEIVAVTPRLPRGLKLNEAIDATQIELSQRYDRLCKRVENMVATHLITASESQTSHHVKKLKEAIRRGLRVRSILDIYVSIIMGRTSSYLREARESYLRLPVTSLNEAKRAVEIFKANAPEPIAIQTVEYYVDILEGIEEQDEFRKARASKAVVQGGQTYKSVYIVDARRGWLDTWSYSVNFDIGLRTLDATTHISRTESAPLSVTPSSLSLTAVAVLTSLVGAAIRFLSVGGRSPSMDQVANQGAGFLVAALTAAVVFNIFDFTSLRDRFRANISWRAAILVGFACGYLNDRILRALQALLG